MVGGGWEREERRGERGEGRERRGGGRGEGKPKSQSKTFYYVCPKSLKTGGSLSPSHTHTHTQPVAPII